MDPSHPSKLFKALMHPARLAILQVLRDGDQCVCHIERVLGYRQSYISQQLTVLREVGMVQDHRQGWNIYYRVSDPRVFELIDLANKLASDGNEPVEYFSLSPTINEAERPVTDKACICPRCTSAAGKNPP